MVYFDRWSIPVLRRDEDEILPRREEVYPHADV
jgi:hypothetical protein